MPFEPIVMVLGLVLGFGVAFLLRKYVPGLGRPKPAPPKPPASRQDARKRAREAAKKQ
jgi:hypothetical protein